MRFKSEVIEMTKLPWLGLVSRQRPPVVLPCYYHKLMLRPAQKIESLWELLILINLAA